MLVFSKTNCSKPQKQKSSVFPPFWTLSNTFQTPVKRCPQKLNTKTKSPGKQRTSSFSERFFWHFNFRSLFCFYLIPPKTSRIFAAFYPFQFNSTLFHPFQPFYVSLVNSHGYGVLILKNQHLSNPVSYTHLDVYKRQIWSIRRNHPACHKNRLP